MRIAIVHPYPWPEVRRGAERYLDDLSTYLAGRGHEVTIVTGTHGPARVERSPDGVETLRLPHIRRGRRFHLGEVETFGVRALGALGRRRPEVVHAFTPSAALAGRLALRPTLYTVLGHPDRAQLPEQRAPRALFVTAARRASVTAVLSHASAAALVDSVGRTAVVLPPGVRMERFSPDLRPRTGPLRLLFSASLADRRKRADLAVAVLARVLETHPDARLALSGEGDPGWVLDAAGRLGDKVRAAVDPLGPGSPADVPERYRAASVTLLPSEHEAFGLAVLESMASGTPVVCSPAGGMPELLGDEPVGAVADAATPESLAAAVVQAWELAGRPETPQRCVDRARRWSWDETVGPAHEVLYTRMAAGDRSIAAPGPW